jgi:hypothetical protein
MTLSALSLLLVGHALPGFLGSKGENRRKHPYHGVKYHKHCRLSTAAQEAASPRNKACP